MTMYDAAGVPAIRASRVRVLVVEAPAHDQLPAARRPLLDVAPDDVELALLHPAVTALRQRQGGRSEP